MNDSQITIEYRDTPEKLCHEADEVIAFLVENLRMLNAIADKYTLIYRQVSRKMSEIRSKLRLSKLVEDLQLSYAAEMQKLEEQLRQGVRVNGVRFKDESAVREQYETEYLEAARSFCTEKLLTRERRTSIATRGDGVKQKCINSYAYLNLGCTLSISMKSTRRAVIEAYSPFDIDYREQFTLVYDGAWRLDAVKYKFHETDRWTSIGV